MIDDQAPAMAKEAGYGFQTQRVSPLYYLRNQLKWDEMDVHGEPQSQDVFLFPLLKTVLVDIPRGVRLRCTSVSGEPDSPPKTILNSWQLQKGPS